MKSRLFFGVILLSAIFSCNEPVKKEQVKEVVISEGKVLYKITYPAENPYKGIPFLPAETQLAFKDGKACFVTSGGMGLLVVVNLLDNKLKKYTSLLINDMGQNMAFNDTPEDVKEQETNPNYKIEPTDVKKTIAGLECRKAIVSDLTNNKKFDIYFYDKAKMSYGASPFKDFPYLIMEYPHTKYGMPMELLAEKVEFAPVDTAVFSVHGEFQWVDKETFMKTMKDLKVPTKFGSQ